MIRLFRLTFPVMLLFALTGSAAAQLIPTPEFSDHAIPVSSVPQSDGSIWVVLDIAILLLALSLATYFALVSRSRRRLIMLTVGSLLWFGFWRQGCVCPIGATQNVALAICDSSYVVPITAVAFFVLPLVFTLFFGRTFCAAVCPLGAAQELVAVRPVNVPRWLDQSLGLVPYYYLGAAVIFAASRTGYIICRYDPFVAFFRLGGSGSMLIFGGSLLLIGVFVGRPYCRYLCPYGAMLRVLSRVSKWRVSITPSECINCRLCEHVCPYGAIRQPTVTQTADHRRRGKLQLAVALLASPLLLALCTVLGISLAVPLSHWDATVRLAEQVRLEELGLVSESTDASDAFRGQGGSVEELYRAAVIRRDHFRWLGGMLGAWVGLVTAGKLIQLSLRRRREEFQADPASCVSCGRCYWYCPVEQVRLGLIEDVSQLVDPQTLGQEIRR